MLPPEPPPPGAEREFRTDFSRHTVPYAEILSGGPPKDGIPAIDRPHFVDVAAADEWLHDREPVILVQVGDEARAYPVQILMWHEIVNDTVGDLPLAVTYCPLCNTGIAFIRQVDDRVLDFGTTGRLRFSNLVMYDRQTESWWQQANGEAIAGELAGQRLPLYPAVLVAWADFKAAHPQGRVLSRETGYRREYGRNPYVGYDAIRTRPFLYEGPEIPATLPAMARVLTLDLGGEAVAYPYEALAREGVVNDTVGGVPVVVFWQAGTASALDDSTVAMGRDVGAATAFVAELDGRRLTFRRESTGIHDVETGSTWDVLGRAVAGELTGRQLTPLVGINHFWFSWAAFRPETRVYGE
ncbi:MAG: DUF3179 domain-containing protein [Caldilineales bacterium]|nr:DUF3179 domain-containing protein [Caldilineales bacterium]